MLVSEVLEKAADDISLYGWQKGANGVFDGPKCINGALLHHAPLEFQSHMFTEARRVLAQYIEGVTDIKHRITDRQTLVVWNDGGHCKSKEDAVSLLRKAAAQAREKGI